MNSTLPATMPDALFALTLALLVLSPLTIAGIALINTGLGRSRSASQSLLGNLAIIAVTAIVFAIVGSVFAGSLPGGAGHVFHMAGKPWNWLGSGPLLLRGLDSAPAQSQLGLVFEFMAVALAALIPWGSGADRWRARRRMCNCRRFVAANHLSNRRSLDLGWRLARPARH